MKYYSSDDEKDCISCSKSEAHWSVRSGHWECMGCGFAWKGELGSPEDKTGMCYYSFLASPWKKIPKGCLMVFGDVETACPFCGRKRQFSDDGDNAFCLRCNVTWTEDEGLMYFPSSADKESGEWEKIPCGCLVVIAKLEKPIGEP